MVAKAKPYAGKLLEPIRIPLDSAGSPGAMVAEARREQLKRMGALADHYDIPDNEARWFLLAWALAQEHVPGLRITWKKQGRNAFRTAEDVMLVVAIVEALQAGKSVRDACRNLTKRKESRFYGRRAEGLRQRFYLIMRATPEGKRWRALVADLSGATAKNV